MKVAHKWISLAPYLLSILRIVAGLLFIQYGTTKLFAWPAAVVPGGGTVPLMSLGGAASAIELVGGLLMLIGLFTRPTAFILSGEMAFAYFIGHAAHMWWAPVVNMGAVAVLFCFLWLYISAAGPGPWSLDAMKRKRPGTRGQGPE
jgi:putative oxidoreductase